MALDNKTESRRPHSQEEYEEEKRILEDKIVNDKDMADKIYAHAMPQEHDAESSGAAADGYAADTGSGTSAEMTDPGDAESGDAEPSYRSPYYQDEDAGAGDTAKGAGSGSGNRNSAGRSDGAGERQRRTSPAGADTDAADRRNGRVGSPEEGASGAASGIRPGVRCINSPDQSETEVESSRMALSQRKKSKTRRIISMVLVELLTLIVIFCSGFVYRYMHMTQSVDFNKDNVKNTNIDVSKMQTMKGYWTIAVFGVDSRDGGVGKGANADVQIIANINMETGDIKLASVFRDTYLNLGSGTRYAKINEAYADGGPEQAVSALNKILDLDIENYITFNWKAVADAITMIGGVDIDITKAEFHYMNAYIHETCIKSGINPKNPAAEYIKGPGYQHLDGVQAVAYARLRYMDSDFERTKRQREVIQQVLEKAKKTDLATLTKIIDTVLPQVAFNIDTSDIIQLAKGVARYNIKDSEGFPTDLKTQMMGKKGDCVIPTSLVSNVSKLHAFLFDDTNYDPSDAVKKYSQKIADDTGTYSGTSVTEAADEYDKKYAKVTEGEAETKESAAKVKKSSETDENGYVISGTDADGNNIYETDADGKKVKSTARTTTAAETDASGNKVTTAAETDADGNKVTSAETTAAESGSTVTEESTAVAAETTKAGTTATTASSEKTTTVAEPGATDSETIAAPGSTTTTAAASSNGPSSNNAGVVEAPGGDSDTANNGPS